MSDESRPIGRLLDDLGVTAPLGDNDRITEVMVIAKVVELDGADGVPLLGIYTGSGTDWITKRGLLHAAREVLEAVPPMLTPDDED